MPQIRWALKQRRLSVMGRKAELIQRMQEADPTGEWINKAIQYATTSEELEEELREAEAEPGANDRPAAEERGIRKQEDESAQREAMVIRRERELLQRELELLRRENQLLRESPNQSMASASTASRVATSIKSISELVGEYKGSEEDFERWQAQINLLRMTYDMDENASRILIGSKLKGKVLEWYHSKTDHLAMRADELLQEMQAMFTRP